MFFLKTLFISFTAFVIVSCGQVTTVITYNPESQSPIEINNPISPNQVINAGTKYPINWNVNSTQPSIVTIQVSYDNGQSWEVVESQILNTGIYEWEVPSRHGEFVLLRVIPSTGSSTSVFQTSSPKNIVLPPPQTGANQTLFATKNYPFSFQLSQPLSADSQLKFESIQKPLHGKILGCLDLSSSRECIYKPDDGYSGTDTLTYQVLDHLGQKSNLATITINIQGGNSSPRYGVILSGGEVGSNPQALLIQSLGMTITQPVQIDDLQRARVKTNFTGVLE